MEGEFLDREVHSLLEEVDPVDRKPLEMYIRMIGSPNKVKDFCQTFLKSVETNGSQFTTCMRMIEKIKEKKLFPILMEAVNKAHKPMQIQSIFKSCNTIPDDIELLKNSLDTIKKAMVQYMDTEVFYHGMSLFYRIIIKFSQLENELKAMEISVQNEDIQNVLRKFDILEKWETANHRGKNIPGYFMNEKDFLDFTLKFVKIQ